MPRNGTGGYTSPTPDVVPGTLIQSAVANGKWDDLGNEITNSIAADGQTTPSANLPMGGFQHTNVADATVANQYAAFGQLPWRIVARTSASAAASVDFTLASTFTMFRLTWGKVGLSSNGAVMGLRCKTAGTPDSGASDYIFQVLQGVATVASATSLSASLIGMLDVTSNAGSLNNGVLHIFNGTASSAFTASGSSFGINSTPTDYLRVLSGRRNANGVKSGIQIVATAGTITGEFFLEGAL